MHWCMFGQSARKYAFFWIITDSQTWPIDIAKLENIKNIDANFTSHVEMEVVRPDASPYGFLGDGIGMIFYRSGTIRISHAVTCQHKQLFDGKCEHLLGAWSETNLIRLITAMRRDMLLWSFGNMCSRSASVPYKHCAGVLISSNLMAETSERKCLKQSDTDFCQGAG